MSQIPENLKYLASHEWIKVDGNVGTVGITDHAQHELTDVVFVELPDVGDACKAGESVAVVESVKAASDIYSPVSGKIIAVNSALSDSPGLVNSSPYEKGWMFKVELSNPAELNHTKSAADYRQLIGS